MIISIIVAMDEARGIGIENKLPWKLSDDLKRFKHLTMGHHIIMGRKTYESIGKPLAGRQTIIISRNSSYHAEGCFVALSLKDALDTAKRRGESEAFVIGGTSIFSEALQISERIYLTRVHTRSKVDTIFPEIDFSQWKEISASTYEADERNEYATSYQILERRI